MGFILHTARYEQGRPETVMTSVVNSATEVISWSDQGASCEFGGFSQYTHQQVADTGSNLPLLPDSIPTKQKTMDTLFFPNFLLPVHLHEVYFTLLSSNLHCSFDLFLVIAASQKQFCLSFSVNRWLLLTECGRRVISGQFNKKTKLMND